MNRSELLTCITGDDVYIGFRHIESLETKLIEAILDIRQHGAFAHLQDFIERVWPGIEQLNRLIKIGAFRFTGKNKKELLWEANFLQKKNAGHSTGNLLFHDKPIEFKLPILRQHPLDDALDEIELMGFSVCDVFDLVDADPSKYLPAKAFKENQQKEITVLGFLITSKPVHTIKQETMFFHTFIDPSGDWLDTVFFPQAARFQNVSGRGFYEMSGKVIDEFGVYILDVHACKRLGVKARDQLK